MMRLTEQIQVSRSLELSKICHLAKNLYNAANYQYRQFLFQLNKKISYYELYRILKNDINYKSLPAQTSQQILLLLIRNWKSFWQAIREYKIDPSKFYKQPRIPKYKKKNGEAVVIFTNQTARIKYNYIYFPKRLIYLH